MTSEFGIAVHAMVFLHHKGDMVSSEVLARQPGPRRWPSPGGRGWWKRTRALWGVTALRARRIP